MRKISFFLGLTAIALLTVPVISHAEKEKEDTYGLLNLFGEVFERVRSDYVEEVSDTQLVESAINGMLTALDPHSSYLNEKSFKEMQVQTKGEFGGLGIEVTMENGLVRVVSPIDDTPAFKAGVKAGDYISHINDEPVMGMTLADAVEKMRGAPGSEIKITLLREGANEPLDITIERAIIKIKSVRARTENNIAYIRITSFSEQAASAMKAEFERLKKEIGTVKGLVLDLRNNPGGLLDQAIEVSDAFLDKGEIVSTRERNPANTRRYSATPGDITGGLPIVVLINNGSASASEIVAGALQDQKRAVILGTKSFGKGSVQTVIPLPEHGAMRLTTSRYYTPSGNSIQAKGITPDILVEQAKIELVDNGKMRLEADLPHRLQNDDEKNKQAIDSKKLEELLKQKEAQQSVKDAAKDDKAKDKDKPAKSKAMGEDTSADDFQLARALDLLRALSVYKKATQQ